jgi:hypothetical protein
MATKEISIRGILLDLERGLTRTTTSQGYEESVGSIETKYGLTKEEVKMIFQHDLLKNRKTKKAPSFILIDDVTPQETPVEVNVTSQLEQVVESTEASITYGNRPVSQRIVQTTPIEVLQAEIDNNQAQF